MADLRSLSANRELKEHLESDIHGSALGPYIHDLVYGANDGIITAFAIVSGSSGAHLAASVIIILGAANLLADGLAMGLGNFLSIRSKTDNYHRVWKEEMREIAEMPDMEREEIRCIYRAKGFSGAELESVVRIITADRHIWADTMMREEHGLAPEDSAHPALHSLVTYLAFVIFGSIPILPYVVPLADRFHFPTAVIATGTALLLVGFLRSWVTRERILRGPFEILCIGSVCAIVAYGVGVALRDISTVF